MKLQIKDSGAWRNVTLWLLAMLKHLATFWHALGYHSWHYPDGERGCHRHCTRPGCIVREVYDDMDDVGWGGVWKTDRTSNKGQGITVNTHGNSLRDE